MDSTAGGVCVALVGRNSRCKTLFMKAASSAATAAISDTTLEEEVSWTSTFTPKQSDLAQVPEHGFSPFGERLLSAWLAHVSAAEIFGEESTRSGKDFCDPLLLVVPAEVAFHKGRPRPSRGGVSPVKAAADRLRERFGGRHVPFAIALSVDFENGGEFGLATMTSVEAFVSSVKDEMALEGVPVVAVTPRTELWLREQEEEGGRVSYRRGDAQFRVHPAFAQLMDKDNIARARAAFDVCGGTGIVTAVSAAVNLKPPVFVFPVGDFFTMQSSGWGGEGAPAATLRTCRLLRASSTARDLFAIEKKQEVLDGDLVSAEIAAAPANSAGIVEPLPLEIDAPIEKGAWLVRLTCSRKAAQMWKVGAAPASGGKGKPLASVQFGDLRSKDRRRGRS
eukprot:g12286.t1